MENMARQTRILITLSDYELRLLTLWAKLHGKARSTYAAQIVGARVEANADLIRKELEYEAAALGVSAKDLEAEWLNDDTDD